MIVSVETTALSQNCFAEFCLQNETFSIFGVLSSEFTAYYLMNLTCICQPIKYLSQLKVKIIIVGDINPFSVFELSFNCLSIREGNFEITQRTGRPMQDLICSSARVHFISFNSGDNYIFKIFFCLFPADQKKSYLNLFNWQDDDVRQLNLFSIKRGFNIAHNLTA